MILVWSLKQNFSLRFKWHGFRIICRFIY